MIDKEYCMSSYLAFRYIEKDNVDFYEGMHHENVKAIPETERILVKTAWDIDQAIYEQVKTFVGKRKGIFLSGGMDSAILASYLPGSDAYTFRFLNGSYQSGELSRAEYYADKYGLKLHYVDIDWSTVEKYLDTLMAAKAAPVHSIEPQILQAALEAKNDGMEIVFIGESSDLIFGGMDQLLSRDWTFDEFKERYTFTDPYKVLKHPADMSYLFERYRKGDDIDFLSFMDDVFSIESTSSYFNAFKVANMRYYDPYAIFKMQDKLDLNKIRNGQSKYLIRELFSIKYPEIPVPEKIPMPRPVDFYFKDWKGPVRAEFRDDIDMSALSGNQKWQLYCLERFLNIYD